ncbi:MAG: WbqC family protein [Clostridia bacterium]|nr:WbqC family protein [Clostridia bacterium]
MIVSIHQPDYISYLGYFYKVSKSDAFVFLDDAQFSNDNMHHWNRIKTPQGECRLKIPVEQHLGDLINKVRTKDELKWKEKHLKTLEMNYKKAPFFEEVFSVFSELLLKEYPSLAQLNIAINTWIIQGFGFEAKLYRSSEMPIHTVREERVIDIVKALDGDVYISGNGAKAYQVDEHFTEKGIRLVYTDYQPIVYQQLWKKAGFLPYMSVLDYLFNCGFNWEYVENAVKEMNGGNR